MTNFYCSYIFVKFSAKKNNMVLLNQPTLVLSPRKASLDEKLELFKFQAKSAPTYTTTQVLLESH